MCNRSKKKKRVKKITNKITNGEYLRSLFDKGIKCVDITKVYYYG